MASQPNPDNGLAPRTALITGASRGLGLEVARGLAARGWHLIIDAREPSSLQEAQEELDRVTQVVAIAGSIEDRAHRIALAEAAAALGGIDAIVNNAGTLGPSPRQPLLDHSLDELQAILSMNVVAQLAVVQALKSSLRPGARILMVTSDAAREAWPGWGGYGMSKAALEQLTAVLAVERPDLFVYSVDPGDMRTAMHQAAFPGEDISDRPLPVVSAPGVIALMEGQLPSGRYAARDIEPPAMTRSQNQAECALEQLEGSSR